MPPTRQPDHHAQETAREPQHSWQRPELVIWGAHGGAGTSTLAVWLQPAWDMDAMSSEPDPPYPAKVSAGRALIVACRSTAWSAQQATKAVAAAVRQGGQVAALAVVSDGWPEPATATSRFRLLQPQVGAVIHVPFIATLRVADDPAAVPLPRSARRALTAIRTAAGRTFPTSPTPQET
jgi:hypothetical protein